MYQKGKVQLVEGWKKVEKIESKDTILPLVNVNDLVQIVDHKLTSHCDKTTKASYRKNIAKSDGNVWQGSR